MRGSNGKASAHLSIAILHLLTGEENRKRKQIKPPKLKIEPRECPCHTSNTSIARTRCTTSGVRSEPGRAPSRTENKFFLNIDYTHAQRVPKVVMQFSDDLSFCTGTKMYRLYFSPLVPYACHAAVVYLTRECQKMSRRPLKSP